MNKILGCIVVTAIGIVVEKKIIDYLKDKNEIKYKIIDNKYLPFDVNNGVILKESELIELLGVDELNYLIDKESIKLIKKD